MKGRLIAVVCAAAMVDCAIAWGLWVNVISFQADWPPNVLFAGVAAVVGAFGASQGLRWRALLPPAAAAFFATLGYTALGFATGSFRERHVELAIIGLYTVYEPLLAVIGGAFGAALVHLLRQPAARAALGDPQRPVASTHEHGVSTMRRFAVNALATVGALTIVGLLTGLVARAMAGSEIGVVTGPDRKPLPRVPVFLDRGTSAIERYVTDGRGEFTFPLEARELRRAVWLICVRGAIPMVGRRDGLAGPTRYLYTPLADSTWGFYRANGWRGPIPRECPRGTDTIGWRYPASAGMPKDAVTATEPVWPR